MLLGIQRVGIVQCLQHVGRVLLASGLVEPARQLAQRGRIPAAGLAIRFERGDRFGATASFVQRTGQQQMRTARSDMLRIELDRSLRRRNRIIPLFALNRLARRLILRLPLVHAREQRAVARAHERIELLVEIAPASS